MLVLIGGVRYVVGGGGVQDVGRQTPDQRAAFKLPGTGVVEPRSVSPQPSQPQW